MNHKQPFVLPFSAINKNDLPIVGGKGANLGEMTQAGFPVPPGFCVTTAVFDQFIAASGKSEQLYAALDSIEPNDLEATRKIGQQIRDEAVSRRDFDNTHRVELAWNQLAESIWNLLSLSMSETAESETDFDRSMASSLSVRELSLPTVRSD